MKPTKFTAKEKKMSQEKRKKRGGEIAKSKSQDCCVRHVIQLTYAAMVDKLIQQEKVNHCNGCAIQHPS